MSLSNMVKTRSFSKRLISHKHAPFVYPANPSMAKQSQQTIEWNHHFAFKPFLVHPIKLDKSKLPLQVGSTNLLDLGTIVNRDGFHTEHFIFPVGYTIRRLYPSAIHPDKYTVMTAKILDENRPQFLVTAADQPGNISVASTIPEACTPFICRKKNPYLSLNRLGFELFGLFNPTLLKMIQDLPGTSNLDRYVWKEFQPMNSRQASRFMAFSQLAKKDLECVLQYHQRR